MNQDHEGDAESNPHAGPASKIDVSGFARAAARRHQDRHERPRQSGSRRHKIDTSGLAKAALVDYAGLATKIDTSGLAKAATADYASLATKIDTSSLAKAATADYASLATKIDVSGLLSKINVGSVASKIDVSSLASKIDMNDLVSKIDVSSRASAVLADYASLATKIDVSSLAKVAAAEYASLAGKVDVSNIASAALAEYAAAGVATSALADYVRLISTSARIARAGSGSEIDDEAVAQVLAVIGAIIWCALLVGIWTQWAAHSGQSIQDMDPIRLLGSAILVGGSTHQAYQRAHALLRWLLAQQRT